MAGAELLLGRIAYEGMLSGGNARGGPFKDALNAMPKSVASRGAATHLAWPSHAERGDPTRSLLHARGNVQRAPGSEPR